MSTVTDDPLQQLARWLDDARDAKEPAPAAMTLATATADGRPSARVVSLKCLDAGTLVFTTALRTRLGELSEQAADRPIPCPAGWGAVRIRPARIEFWAESADRLHDRLVYKADGDGWRCSRLAP